MFVLLIVTLFLFLLFIPIPLKLYINYQEGFYEIKFYKILLFSSDSGLINKYINKSKIKKEKEDSNKKNNKKDFIKNNKRKKVKKKLSISLLYKNLSNNKFKPYFLIDSDIKFSTEDAANTAILYGVLNSINPIIYKIISILFKVKHYDNKFLPTFKDQNTINISLMCIFKINIAKVIYMLFLINKSSISIKGGAQ